MANLVLRPVQKARFPVIRFITAAATLLPVQARCIACSGAIGRSSCRAAAGNNIVSARHDYGDCCVRRAAPRDAAVDDICFAHHGGGSDCDCCAKPSRTVPHNESLSQLAKLVDALHFAVFQLPDVKNNQRSAEALTLADLSPLIPHRILHCSWQI